MAEPTSFTLQVTRDNFSTPAQGETLSTISFDLVTVAFVSANFVVPDKLNMVIITYGPSDALVVMTIDSPVVLPVVGPPVLRQPGQRIIPSRYIMRVKPGVSINLISDIALSVSAEFFLS